MRLVLVLAGPRTGELPLLPALVPRELSHRKSVHWGDADNRVTYHSTGDSRRLRSVRKYSHFERSPLDSSLVLGETLKKDFHQVAKLAHRASNVSLKRLCIATWSLESSSFISVKLSRK
jgi:hypothetical protein